MKFRIYSLLLGGAVLATTMFSCKKSADTAEQDINDKELSAAVIASGSIAVSPLSTTLSATSSKKDSLYLVGCLPAKGKKDTVAASALLTSISSYLTTNYSGYGSDLLNQGNNLSRSVSGNSVIDSRSNIITRVFSFGLTYNLSKFGAKGTTFRVDPD